MKAGNLNSWNPLGHSRPVMELLYLFLYQVVILNLKGQFYQSLANFFSVFKFLQKIVRFNNVYTEIYYNNFHIKCHELMKHNLLTNEALDFCTV